MFRDHSAPKLLGHQAQRSNPRFYVKTRGLFLEIEYSVHVIEAFTPVICVQDKSSEDYKADCIIIWCVRKGCVTFTAL